MDKARWAAEAELESAQALPAAFLREVFDSPEARQWPKRSIRDLCRSIDYGYTTAADFSADGPRFLRITDIQRGEVRWEEVPGCAISASEEASYTLADGDILFARTGGTTGKSYLIRRPPRAVFASYLIRLRPTSLVTPDYLYAFLQSDQYWRYVRATARGGAQPNLNATLLGDIALPIPSPNRQVAVTTALSARLQSTQQVQADLQRQLAHLATLPAALLRAAFNGEF